MSGQLYNEEAERAVLGAIMRSADAFFEVSGNLRAEHFYLAEHQRIFNVVKTICESGQRLSPIAIKVRLPAQNEKGIAVESTIGILLKEAEEVESALDFVDIIKSLWKQRQLNEFASLTRKLVDSASKVAEEKLLELRQRLEHISDDTSEVATTSFGEAARNAVNETAKNYQSKGKAGIGIYTGINELDDLIGPIMPSNLVTLLAQSGHAKTALVTQILRAAASPSLDMAGGNQPSLFISMEMKAHEIARRVLASDLGIETRRQRMGDISEAEYRNLDGAAKYLESLPIIFDDRGPMTIEEIVASLRKAKRLHKIRAAAVDHLKIIRPSRSNWNTVQTIENAVTILKSVAKELDIAIIQLAQVVQETTKRDSSWRLKDGDGYGGGALKENSDIMLASVLPAEWLKQREPPDDEANRRDHDDWVTNLARWQGKAEFGALKIRDGQNGNWKTVPFDGPRMLFGERAIEAAKTGVFEDVEFR